MSEELKDLNPQITSTKVGTRKLREIKIYPLSVGDQIKMSDLITKALQKFFIGSDKGDVEYVTFLLDLIRKNIVRILEYVMDEKVSNAFLDDITNFQLSEIAKIIYEVNYESPAKNVESLLSQAKNLFLLGGQLPQSVKDTLDMDLSTTSENHSEKEE